MVLGIKGVTMETEIKGKAVVLGIKTAPVESGMQRAPVETGIQRGRRWCQGSGVRGGDGDGDRDRAPAGEALCCRHGSRERKKEGSEIGFSAVRVSWAFGPVMWACGASDEGRRNLFDVLVCGQNKEHIPPF
jgi:hypothetical protein